MASLLTPTSVMMRGVSSRGGSSRGGSSGSRGRGSRGKGRQNTPREERGGGSGESKATSHGTPGTSRTSRTPRIRTPRSTPRSTPRRGKQQQNNVLAAVACASPPTPKDELAVAQRIAGDGALRGCPAHIGATLLKVLGPNGVALVVGPRRDVDALLATRPETRAVGAPCERGQVVRVDYEATGPDSPRLVVKRKKNKYAGSVHVGGTDRAGMLVAVSISDLCCDRDHDRDHPGDDEDRTHQSKESRGSPHRRKTKEMSEQQRKAVDQALVAAVSDTVAAMDRPGVKFKLKIEGAEIGHHLKMVRRRLQQVRELRRGAQDDAIVLMVQEWPEKYQIDIPGGRRELGETTLVATIRELLEETGIDFRGKPPLAGGWCEPFTDRDGVTQGMFFSVRDLDLGNTAAAAAAAVEDGGSGIDGSSSGAGESKG